MTDVHMAIVGVLCVLALGGYLWLCDRVRR
jgi:hypothetical protein